MTDETRLPKPSGACVRCGKSLPNAGMSRHLPACVGRGDGLQVVVTGGRSMYWIHLALAPGASFDDLDHLLRKTWLECCGHMSGFVLSKRRRVHWDGGDHDMDEPVAAVLGAGEKFVHEYDYGSTTRLEGRVAGRIAAGPDKVTLLARNDAIAWPCDCCDTGVATTVCPNCFAKACDACGEPCDCYDPDDGGYLPVVNSPRMGVCGYEG